MLPNKPAYSDHRGRVQRVWSGSGTVFRLQEQGPLSLLCLELGGTWNCLALAKKVTVASGHTSCMSFSIIYGWLLMLGVYPHVHWRTQGTNAQKVGLPSEHPRKHMGTVGTF